MGRQDGERQPTRGPSTRRKIWAIVISLTLAGTATLVFLIVITSFIIETLDGVDLYYIVGTGLTIYAQDHDGLYPPPHPDGHAFMFDEQLLIPDYATSNEHWRLPEQPGWHPARRSQYRGEVGGETPYRYIYLGYAVSNEEELEALIEALEAQRAAGTLSGEDIPVEPGRGSFGGDVLYRLRTDFAEVLERDGHEAASDDIELSRMIDQIPLMVERMDPEGRGAWGLVLFLSRKMERMDFPGEFPMTREFMEPVYEFEAGASVKTVDD